MKTTLQTPAWKRELFPTPEIEHRINRAPAVLLKHGTWLDLRMLKRSIVFATLIAFSVTTGFAASKGSGSKGTGSKHSSTTARGYTTKAGTSVSSYKKTTSDSTQKNNYSAKSNLNPHTGKTGTKTPTK